MAAKKKKQYGFAIGLLIGAAYVTGVYFFGFLDRTGMTHVDNNIPQWVDCTDGKDVWIAGHKKPTFFCTHYERNGVSLESDQ